MQSPKDRYGFRLPLKLGSSWRWTLGLIFLFREELGRHEEWEVRESGYRKRETGINCGKQARGACRGELALLLGQLAVVTTWFALEQSWPWLRLAAVGMQWLSTRQPCNPWCWGFAFLPSVKLLQMMPLFGLEKHFLGHGTASRFPARVGKRGRALGDFPIVAYYCLQTS